MSPEGLLYVTITSLGDIIIKWSFNNKLTAKHLSISLLLKNIGLLGWFS